MIRLGIDLGGSKIEIVALAADGSERFRRRVPTPQDGYLPVLDAIADLVAAADAAVGDARQRRHRYAGVDLARDRPAARLELDISE